LTSSFHALDDGGVPERLALNVHRPGTWLPVPVSATQHNRRKAARTPRAARKTPLARNWVSTFPLALLMWRIDRQTSLPVAPGIWNCGLPIVRLLHGI